MLTWLEQKTASVGASLLAPTEAWKGRLPMGVAHPDHPVATPTKVFEHQPECATPGAASRVSMQVRRPQSAFVLMLVPMHGGCAALTQMPDGQGNASPFRATHQVFNRGQIGTESRSR